MKLATSTREQLTLIVQSARFQRLILLFIIFLALGRKLYLAAYWNSIQPNSPARLIGDEPGYDNIARELLAGWGFTWPGRVPLYPIWLAGVYSMTGGSYGAVPYAQILLSVATVLLTYTLGRRQFGPGVGLLAALLIVLTYPLVHQTLRLMSEVLYASSPGDRRRGLGAIRFRIGLPDGAG
jgi:hypothetical protein